MNCTENVIQLNLPYFQDFFETHFSFVSKSISNNDRSSFHHFQNSFFLVVNLSVNKSNENITCKRNEMERKKNHWKRIENWRKKATIIALKNIYDKWLRSSGMGSGNNYKIRLFTSEIQERKTARKKRVNFSMNDLN